MTADAQFESILEAYPVRLSNFEGPLDLLLHLIRKHEVNVYDIPIALIARQYLDYLDLMRELDLEIAGAAAGDQGEIELRATCADGSGSLERVIAIASGLGAGRYVVATVTGLPAGASCSVAQTIDGENASAELQASSIAPNITS